MMQDFTRFLTVADFHHISNRELLWAGFECKKKTLGSRWPQGISVFSDAVSDGTWEMLRLPGSVSQVVRSLLPGGGSLKDSKVAMSASTMV